MRTFFRAVVAASVLLAAISASAPVFADVLAGWQSLQPGGRGHDGGVSID